MPVVMDADRMGRTLTRIAHEIVERNRGMESLALVGVRTRGVPIAGRLAARLRELIGNIPPSSPSIALFKDGQLVHFIPRFQIESRDAFQISQHLQEAFKEHCGAGSAVTSR